MKLLHNCINSSVYAGIPCVPCPFLREKDVFSLVSSIENSSETF